MDYFQNLTHVRDGQFRVSRESRTTRGMRYSIQFYFGKTISENRFVCNEICAFSHMHISVFFLHWFGSFLEAEIMFSKHMDNSSLKTQNCNFHESECGILL